METLDRRTNEVKRLLESGTSNTTRFAMSADFSQLPLKSEDELLKLEEVLTDKDDLVQLVKLTKFISLIPARLICLICNFYWTGEFYWQNRWENCQGYCYKNNGGAFDRRTGHKL